MIWSGLFTVDLWSGLKYIFSAGSRQTFGCFRLAFPTKQQLRSSRNLDQPIVPMNRVRRATFRFSKRDRPGTRAGHLVAWREISAAPTNGPFYPIGERPTPGGTKCNQYKHTIKPSYSAGNEPDWNDTWWRNMSLTKAPMNPRPIGDRKIGVKRLMVAKGKKSYLVHI